jgi:serine/threonine protein kinase
MGSSEQLMSDDSRYILVERISRGGMAEIFLGRQEGKDGFKRICCIKRILPHYAQDKEYIEMFRDEAHICKRLQHANIVRVEGFEEVDNSYALIMEFVDGADLRKVLAACENSKIPLPVPMALFIAAEVARGLHYAHTKIDEITGKPLKIVHRDISPQNILVSYEGDVKFTDFGIADAKSKSTETKPGIVKGKYSYMSPEQIMAKPVDARTDVFALNIVLWEMLAMERLFHGENDVVTIQKVKACEVRPLPRKKRDGEEIDEALEQVVMRGLNKDIRRRYKDAYEFEFAVRNYLNKTYPHFTAKDLSDFIRKLMPKRRNENQENIRKALTSPRLKASVDSSNSNFPKTDASASHVASISQEPILSAIGAPTGLSNATYSGNIDLPIANHDIAAARQRSQISNIANRPVTIQRPVGGQSRVVQNPARIVMPRHHRETASRSLIQILAVISLIAVMAVGVKVFFARAPATLLLQTVPATVKIKLGDQALDNGSYIKTPRRIHPLPSGKYSVEISRDGFKSQTLSIAAAPGDTITRDTITLERSARMAAITLKIGEPNIKSVYIEVDDGIDSGYAPKNIMNITLDKTHNLKVYPKGNKGSFFQCNFKPNSSNWSKPFVITILPNARRCTYSN